MADTITNIIGKDVKLYNNGDGTYSLAIKSAGGDVEVTGIVAIDQATDGANGVVTKEGSVTNATLQEGEAIVGRFGIDQSTDGVTNKVQARNSSHDNFNANATIQISNADVSDANPVPTKIENKILPLVFHDEQTVPDSGLEFEVGEYKNLRVGISGTATSHEIMFRGESGGVVTALTGIREDGLLLGTSTTSLGEVWEFDIESYDKVWFGLPAVEGGNITIKGKAGN